MRESLFEASFSDTASYEKCPLMPVEKLGDLKTNLQKCCQLQHHVSPLSVGHTNFFRALHLYRSEWEVGGKLYHLQRSAKKGTKLLVDAILYTLVEYERTGEISSFAFSQDQATFSCTFWWQFQWLETCLLSKYQKKYIWISSFI